MRLTFVPIMYVSGRRYLYGLPHSRQYFSQTFDWSYKQMKKGPILGHQSIGKSTPFQSFQNIELFSLKYPVSHKSRRVKCSIVIRRFPSRTSVRPLPLTFHIFAFSLTPERVLTAYDRKQVRYFLYQVCVFRSGRKTKMAVPACDWLVHFQFLLCKHWTEFDETLKEASTKRPLTNLFPAWSENK